MNPSASIDSASSAPPASDAIARRAYELWEQEGRPEGADLRHWLQAEQEVQTRSGPDNGIRSDATPETPGSTGSDVRPLQGTRAAAAAGREARRGSNAPFSSEKNTLGNGNNPSAARRKPANAPAL